jgi:hypothetical protein
MDNFSPQNRFSPEENTQVTRRSSRRLTRGGMRRVPKSGSAFRTWFPAVLLALALLGPGSAAAANLEVDVSNSPYYFWSNEAWDNETVGVTGTGTVSQFSYSNTISQNLVIGDQTGSNGSYYLNSTTLSVGGSETIGNNGRGYFEQWTGSTHTITNSLTLGAGTGTGTYNLKGGSLTTGNLVINAASSFTQGAGSFTSGGLDNAGRFQVDRSASTTVTGDTLNRATGTVSVAYSNVSWGGTFTNNGAYIAKETTTSTFNNLVVGPSGFLTGGAWDTFFIKGDFDNQSTRYAAWNTSASILKFVTDDNGDTSHTFHLTGHESGTVFAWNKLDLAPENTLTLDGGSAVYFKEILGVEVVGDEIKNLIFPGIKIYFDLTLPSNKYLADVAWQPGILFEPVPLPASAWLFLSGLAGLGFWRRRKNTSR